jgi:hypothetical protein
MSLFFFCLLPVVSFRLLFLCLFLFFGDAFIGTQEIGFASLGGLGHEDRILGFFCPA